MFPGFWSLPSVPSKRSGCSILSWRRWGTSPTLLPASLQFLHSASPLTSAHNVARRQARPAGGQPPLPWLHTQRVLGAESCRQGAVVTLRLHCPCHGSPMEEATVWWETHRHDFQRASSPQSARLLGDPGIITLPLWAFLASVVKFRAWVRSLKALLVVAFLQGSWLNCGPALGLQTAGRPWGSRET